MKLVKNEGGTWSVHVKGKNGKAHQFSTNTKEFAMAKRVVSEAKIKELEMAAEIGALTQEVVSVLLTGSRMTVEKAIEPWKTWMQMVNYAPRTIADGELRVRCWMKSANVTNKQLSAITEYDINPWVNETSKRKATTRRTTLALVRNFFDFCSRKGWLQGNPSRLCDVDLSKLSHEQKERRPTPTWTDEEVKRVLDYTDPDKEQMFVPTKENVPIASSDKLWYQPPNLLLHRNYYRRINQPNPFWHAAVALSRHTGLRLGDCCCLEWASLVTPGEITVWTIKRDRRINVPIPDEVVRALAHIPPEDPTYVFPIQRSRYLERGALLSQKFTRILNGAKIVGKSFHGLRVAYVTEQYQAGKSLEEIAKNVGHVDTGTTWGYVRAADRTPEPKGNGD